MEVTYVDDKNLKTIEDYAVFLTTGMLSLLTLQNFQVTAIRQGILKEDHIERANTIIWDIRRALKMYKDQLESILELLPDNFNPDSIIENMKASELKKARSMTRKKKCDT